MAIERASTGAAIEAGVGTVVEAAAEAAAKVAVGAVVPEAAAVPVSAVETCAEVAEAVVDAAVVADFRAPVTGVPEVVGTAVAPPSGRPESVGVRRKDPGAVDPVVAGVLIVGPIAGRPDIAIAGDFGLVVLRNGRGRGFGSGRALLVAVH